MRIILISLVFLLIFISVVNAEDLFSQRELLQKYQFTALEKKLESYNKGYLVGEISYRDYLWAFSTLWTKSDFKSEGLKAAIDKWVIENPDSAYANIVAGKYYLDLGYDARGVEWASETSEEQFSEMQKYFKKAIPYTEKGLKLNSEIIEGYKTVISRMKSAKENTTKDLLNYLETAPEIVKQKTAVWIELLYSITPRWGGSYAEMEYIIDNKLPKRPHQFSAGDISLLEDMIYHPLSLYCILGCIFLLD